jgi:hypothetical protein
MKLELCATKPPIEKPSTSTFASPSALMRERKREFDAKRAENTVERLEWEAGVAVDYAIACVEQAEVAVLDPIAGRSEAEAAKAH